MFRTSPTLLASAMVITTSCLTARLFAAEPVVTETHEGGTSVIRITPADGGEKVYRIDLSQRHSPASKQNARSCSASWD